MIIDLMNLVSTNDANGKRVTVSAVEDSTGGPEKFTFQIGSQTIPVTKTFRPDDDQPVTVTHTESGECRVVVTVAGSQQKIDEIRDLNKAKDDGSGVKVSTGQP
jgi:hypothetical protein